MDADQYKAQRKDFLTRQEVAAHLGVTQPRVSQMMNERVLPMPRTRVRGLGKGPAKLAWRKSAIAKTLAQLRKARSN